MYIFSMENPFWRFVGRVVDLVWINVLTLVCCLPVFTIGAAISAMDKILIQIVVKEEGSLTKGYFKAFKENFKRSTVVWLPSLFALLILFYNAWLIHQGVMDGLGKGMITVAGVSIGILAVVIVSVLQYYLALTARFDADLKQTLKNAGLLAFAFFPRTLSILVIMLFPVALMMLSDYFLMFWFVYGLAIPGYFIAQIFAGIFYKIQLTQTMDEVEADALVEKTEELSDASTIE
ncbi:MAG: YesL family protein [Lachnospiraceae bacterium]|nr:YesL family protein [Lachnospiraceae bacterium]